MSDEYPKMLYKPGSEIEWDGAKFDTLIVDSLDAEEAVSADGWKSAAALVQPEEPSLLDGSAKDIEAALADVETDALADLLDAEKAGKTRKSVIALIEAEIAKRLAA